MLMIPIDTGNKAIKTENFEFHSGITALESMPGENEEALMFQDKYYRLSHERNVYLPDKTLDDRYYLLTLFAIAKELEKLRQSRPFIPGELISMELVVGLPPLYYRSQYKKFRDYFYREGRLVHFAYMGRSYRLAFSNVYVHMQTYAAYLYLAKELKLSTYPKVLMIDIGGYTLDYMLLEQPGTCEYQVSAGTDQTGNPVYFCYELELRHLLRVKQELGWKKQGTILCFSYQKSILEYYFGKEVSYREILTEKVMEYLEGL